MKTRRKGDLKSRGGLEGKRSGDPWPLGSTIKPSKLEGLPGHRKKKSTGRSKRGKRKEGIVKLWVHRES